MKLQIFLDKLKNSRLNLIFPFSRFTIQGTSMFPVLKEGQDVLVFNWAYLFFKPKKGEIVVISYKGKKMIKRIQISSGRGISVVGDNLKESTDSRNFGQISLKDIVGKVIYVR